MNPFYYILSSFHRSVWLVVIFYFSELKQEGLADASIARDDSSTLPGDDPFPRTRMHHDHNAR